MSTGFFKNQNEPYYSFDITIELNDSLEDLAEQAYAEYFKHSTNVRQYKKKDMNLIRVTLFNLVYAAKNHPNDNIVYSQNDKDYVASAQHNINNVSKKIITIIDALGELGYIQDMIPGFYDHNNRLNNRRARMKPGQKILDYISEPEFIFSEPEIKAVAKPFNEIIIRDEAKYNIDYEETSEIARMRKNVQFINKHVENYEVELVLDEEERQLLVDKVNEIFDNKYLRYAFEDIPLFKSDKMRLQRIFSIDESLKYGGRYYGTWVHDIFAKVHKFRKYLTLNGEAICEYDFGSFHPSMCYHKLGIVLSPEEDLYEIPINDYKENRGIAKLALNTILNIKGKSFKDGRNKAISSVTKELYGHWHAKGRDFVEEVIDKQIEKHDAIKEFFFTGIGLEMMRTDSDIAEIVMLDLIGRGIPCLPVHDSFITQKKFAKELQESMRKAYVQVMDMEPLSVSDAFEKWKPLPREPDLF